MYQVETVTMVTPDIPGNQLRGMVPEDTTCFEAS